MYHGVKVALGIMIPALVLYNLGLLESMITFPLGVAMTSSADSPGPPHHRRNGMLISIGINVLILLISGITRHNDYLVALNLVIFGLLFSMTGVFGNRANSIGISALIVFTLTLNERLTLTNYVWQSLYFLLGGIWYFLFSSLLYRLSPYQPVLQLLGETLMETSEYLKVRASLYRPGVKFDQQYRQLVELQLKIHNHQQELREMLYATRVFVKESTPKSRRVMMIFLDSVDLFESIMTTQTEFEKLHEDFGDTDILNQFAENIEMIAESIQDIGLSLQEVIIPLRNWPDLDAKFNESNEAFEYLRNTRLQKGGNVEGFIRLRQVLHRIQDLTQRTKRLKVYLMEGEENNQPAVTNTGDINLQQFKPIQEISFDIFKSNFTLKSTTFRNAISMVIALMSGFLISKIFLIGNGFWILMTIAATLRPSFALAKSRNFQRVAGTLIGAGFSFLILFLIHDPGILLAVLIVAIIIGFGLIKVNYATGIAGITLYVILSFYFLHPVDVNTILIDRIIDTIIGCFIAYMAALMVLPNWASDQFEYEISDTIEKTRNYFLQAAKFFQSGPPPILEYKVARKEAYVALANLSGKLQQVISEPNRPRELMTYYHQLVTINHMLTSHIAGLAFYGNQSWEKYQQDEFDPMIKFILQQFKKALEINETETPQPLGNHSIPINKKVTRLLNERKASLEFGLNHTPVEVRKEMTELKIITDQFRLISAALNDEIRVLNKIHSPVVKEELTLQERLRTLLRLKTREGKGIHENGK